MIIKNINVYNLYPAILGIRNSFKSKDKSDSKKFFGIDWYSEDDIKHENKLWTSFNHCAIGQDDEKLIKKLLKRNDEYGHQERKFLRQILVSMDIKGSIKFWAQMDTFKIGTVRNSESTMHSITKGELVQEDFEKEINDEQILFINNCIEDYKICKDESIRKKIFETIDANLPAGYLLESHWTGNYEVLRNIYHGRKNHKMYWWKEFCSYIEKLPYFDLMIKGE